MKKPISILVAVAALLCMWTSCTQNEETGSLQFGLEWSDDSELKSAVADYHVTAALITITGENGEVIYDKEYLPIYQFGDAYTTRSLELPLGGYLLTEFMLVDSSGVVIWATPKAGSPLAHLVNQPLPIPFFISAQQTTSLAVEVIRVRDYPPADFGYVNFHIGFVDRFCLKVFYSTRCMELWNDSIMGPDGSTAPIYQPMLTIWSEDRMLVHAPLMAGLNHYDVPVVDSWYKIIATDCQGQMVYENIFPLRELLEHRCADIFPPLLIYRDPVPGIIITPEDLTEPTIKQGVFGSISVPVDDTLYTPNGDFFPLFRDIYFFPYSVMDSIYTFAPVDCYFPPELLPMPPVAIVRTNSSGYFQVPLPVGEYLYLVKEEDRFYVDAFISSHRPGYVKVYPEEVTHLMIHIIDCSMWM